MQKYISLLKYYIEKNAVCQPHTPISEAACTKCMRLSVWIHNEGLFVNADFN